MGTIAAALGCVIGTIVAMGWQLGQNESLCIMVLTGFAVDYVVHLSHAYMESTAPNRLERVHDALRDLGISVFWGMLTSMFAAAALASCQIQFLSKFGIFFMLTISYAYLWSVLFLMPLLACIGPEPVAAPPGKEMLKELQMASAPPSPPGPEQDDGSFTEHAGRRPGHQIV
jgi:predicted RND superfamily exporter protein